MFVLVFISLSFAYMQVVIVEQWWKFGNFRFRLSRTLEFQESELLEMIRDGTTHKMNVVYYDDDDIGTEHLGDSSRNTSKSFNDSTAQSEKEFELVMQSKDSNKADDKKVGNRFQTLDLGAMVMNESDFMEKPLMVLFSSWIHSVEKYRVHSILRQNWKSWTSIKPMVFTKDPKVRAECRKNGWLTRGISVVDRTCLGPPVLSAMFTDLYKTHDAYFYGYSNADIAFGDGLRETMEFLFYHFVPWKSKPILVVGRRYNVNFMKYQNESWNTPSDVKKMVKHGKLVIRSTDYFFTNKVFPWGQAPKVSIGRPFVVRAIIGWAIRRGYIVIDATRTIEAVHLTTHDGVFASWHVKGVRCNQHVLAAAHWTIPTGLGHCECAKLETFRGNNGKIQMRHRPRSKTICAR